MFMSEYRLITVDPGHFHAALIQKEAYPGVSNRVAVYAPLSTDLTDHVNRIALVEPHNAVHVVGEVGRERGVDGDAVRNAGVSLLLDERGVKMTRVDGNEAVFGHEHLRLL